ncbi:hypothetical protein NYZ99_19490 [Maribacter litopenaei]|uniref:Immunity protein 44 n=1 Tax=Maribacter litopenaei TaxID=2976127 RepID=A0ABY5Y790_9FLAO|nr:hypothetical protein [Maribacter litopenaei]UWX54892.1 hypothetical protein NYZ99_19490 [Maribacter litopenaei]
MNILNFFKKDPNKLSKDEKEAALILADIVYGNKIGDPNYLENGYDKLAEGLYYLSFKRTGRRPVNFRLAENNPFLAIEKPKILYYVAVFKTIKESIIAFSNNPIVIERENTIKEYEQCILEILKTSSEEIRQI